jgi:hypothetical protein
MDSIRNYLGEKEFRISEILQFGIMFLLSGFLIGGGIIILKDEDIFKKIYEGYQELKTVDPDDDVPDDDVFDTVGMIGSSSSDYVDTRPIIPNEEKLIGLYTGSQNQECSEGAYKFESPQSNGTIIYTCVKCPDGRILKYSDGTSVSSEEIDTTKIIANDRQSGMRCKLPTQTQTSEVVRPIPAAAASQGAPVVSNTWTADLPDDLLLVNLQKNVKLIRKNSLINTITAWTMIVLGSIISIYQIYNLFFS